MTSGALSFTSFSNQALADALKESNEQRRARLQALLNDVLGVRRLAAIDLVQTQRVVDDCEAAVQCLSAMLRQLSGQPDASSPDEK